MKKKIALFLIMVIMVNMIVWADDGLDSGTEEVLWIIVIALIGVAILVPIILTSEADAPDDGIRLASSQTGERVPKTNFGSVMNFLQHIEIGQTQNNKVYLGFRFQL
jgi:hypothetical protein